MVKRRSLSEAWTPQARGKFRWECRSLVTRGPEAGGSVRQFSGALPSGCLFLCYSAYPAMRQAPSGNSVARSALVVVHTAQVSLGQPNTVPTPSPASHEQSPSGLQTCPLPASCSQMQTCLPAMWRETPGEREKLLLQSLEEESLGESQREITFQLKNVIVLSSFNLLFPSP